ncbi:hypothetical protein D9M68_733360 [compost metagenome]
MLINTIYPETVEFKQRAIPLRVTPCEVIVHRYYVYALPGKGIEIGRQCTHEGFSFTGGHLGNFTAV